MFLKILVTLTVLFGSVLSYQGLGDIYDEKYVCVTSKSNVNNDMAKSQRRILLISPQKNYLYNRSWYALIFIALFASYL